MLFGWLAVDKGSILAFFLPTCIGPSLLHEFKRMDYVQFPCHFSGMDTTWTWHNSLFFAVKLPIHAFFSNIFGKKGIFP